MPLPYDQSYNPGQNSLFQALGMGPVPPAYQALFGNQRPLPPGLPVPQRPMAPQPEGTSQLTYGNQYGAMNTADFGGNRVRQISGPQGAWQVGPNADQADVSRVSQMAAGNGRPNYGTAPGFRQAVAGMESGPGGVLQMPEFRPNLDFAYLNQQVNQRGGANLMGAPRDAMLMQQAGLEEQSAERARQAWIQAQGVQAELMKGQAALGQAEAAKTVAGNSSPAQLRHQEFTQKRAVDIYEKAKAEGRAITMSAAFAQANDEAASIGMGGPPPAAGTTAPGTPPAPGAPAAPATAGPGGGASQQARELLEQANKDGKFDLNEFLKRSNPNSPLSAEVAGQIPGVYGAQGYKNTPFELQRDIDAALMGKLQRLNQLTGSGANFEGYQVRDISQNPFTFEEGLFGPGGEQIPVPWLRRPGITGLVGSMLPGQPSPAQLNAELQRLAQLRGAFKPKALPNR